MKNTHHLYLILLTLTATLGGLLFGYDTAVISGTVDSLKVNFVLPYNWTEGLANSRHGLVVSSALVGCIIGGLTGGLVSLHLGRKRGLILAASLFLISAIGSSMPEIFIQKIGTADHTFIIHFIIYRIIGGIGVGLASMLAPMYIAEIAPAAIRGKLVSWNQFAIIFGMLVVYFVNYSIARQGDDQWLHQVGWRWMFASETIPASLFLALLFIVPETPRYLLITNREDEALGVLTKINGAEKAKEVLRDIKETLRNTTVSGKLFSFGIGVIVIGILLSVFQQFVGINVVLYYAPAIFKDMGAQTDSSLLSTIYVGIVNLVFTIIAIVTVDRFGRKPLMIIGALVMAFAMIALGTTFFISLKEIYIDGEIANQFGSKKAAISAFTLILLYIAGFAMSWGPVTWVLLSEIFPNKIRGRAMAIAVAFQWIANLAISWTFPIMNNSTALNEKFNHGFAYWIYGLMGILAALFVYRFVPETKKKTLEEIEAFWKK